MASGTAPAVCAPASSDQDTRDWEKDFFTTWLRLMERQNDATELTQVLQSHLAQTGEAATKWQDARHQANLLSANDKAMTELVALLNEFFFRDVVPAFKRARQVSVAAPRHAQDPLDCYLEHGDEGTTMPQAFVDDMSGWGATQTQEREQNTSQEKKKNADGGGDSEEESDDDIPADKYHDMLIANSLKLTAMQAPDYSSVVQAPLIRQPPTASQVVSGTTRTSAPAPAAANHRVSKGKTNKRRRTVPPPIMTDFPPQLISVSAGSTPPTQSRSLVEVTQKKDRIGKRAAANLIAEQVLGARTYGSAKEYFIRWQGVKVPLWISRRKAPSQAKELIDLYLTGLRARDGALADRDAVDQTRRVSRKISRNGSHDQQRGATGRGGGGHEAAFYTVDHIVNNRLFNNQRQYLVRWESYDESEDTWEDADMLRADVPDIVDAYEEHLLRDRARAKSVQSAISGLIRDTGPKSAAQKKRNVAKAGNEYATDKLPAVRRHVDGERFKEKRRRIATNKKVECNGADGDNTSDDDYQFDLEEAELEEYSDEEFADKLNN